MIADVTKNAPFVSPLIGANLSVKKNTAQQKSSSTTNEKAGFTRVSSRDSIQQLRRTISELRSKLSEIMTGNDSTETKTLRAQSIEFTITEIETLIAQKQRPKNQKTIHSVYVNNQDLKKPDDQSVDTSMLTISTTSGSQLTMPTIAGTFDFST